MSSRLRELIRAVRQCKTAQDERDAIAKESAALRQAFKDQDVHYRHRNVAKLMYIHMLGYPTHFGQMETLKLIASNGFPEKRIGYLGLMILLDERQEVLMLVTNSIKQDLNQRNQYIAGLALTALGNISSTDMARDLAPDIERMLGANNAYIRKKAALCACRILRKVPELIDQFLEKAASLLQDRHHGVLLTGVTLMLEICDIQPSAIQEYREHVPMLCKILKSLLMSGFAPEHDVGGITDPFLQVKVLRLLRLLGKGSAEASDQMSDILAQVASNTESNRNAGNAILYECVQTIMENESIAGLRVLAINILGRFLSNRDNNIRYVALETLAKVVAVDTVAVQRHRNTVVECVKDADISIRRRALDLVYALVNENNIKTLTKELLDYLQVCDAEFKPDLTSKICMLIQRYAPDKRWYVDSLIQVLVQAGMFVKEEAVRAFVVMVSNATQLQGYASRQLHKAVSTAMETAGESMKIAALWCIGEFGEQIVNNTNPLDGEEITSTTADDLVTLVEAILQLPNLTAKVKEYALTALIKLSARLPTQVERIKQDIGINSRSIQLEVQQRACEFTRMFNFQNRAQLVEHIPALDETTYSQNLTSQAVVDSAAPAPTSGAVANGTAAPAATDLLDLLSLDDPPASTAPPPASGLADLLGGTPAAAPAAPVAAAPVVDLLGDLLGGGGASAAPAVAAPAAGGGFDILGSLGGAAPAAPSPVLPTIQAFDKNGIKIMFELSKPGQPSQTNIKAMCTNSSGVQITDFSLQAAVPKFMQLKLDPASSNVLPPGGSATQLLHINNTMHGQKPLVMRLRVSYTANGSPVVEQGEVSGFPPGY